MIIFGLFLINTLGVFGTHVCFKKEKCTQIHNIRIQRRERLSNNCGEGLCYCDDNEAICPGYEHRGRLHYIPKLPATITSLIFCGNYLPYINETTFKNISNISELHLFNNQVTAIAGNAFKYLATLKSLSLSDPGFQAIEISRAFSSLKKSTIQDICLEQQSWTIIPNDFFLQLLTSKIQRVDLSSQIQEIDTKIFSSLRYLSILVLKNNKLRSFVIKSHVLYNIQILNINKNRISDIPIFCDADQFGESFLPKLDSLDLSDNIITVLKEGDFKCLEKLRRLYVALNPIKMIGDNVISSLYSLTLLELTSIGSGGLTVIGNYALNSSSLRWLNFGGNILQVNHGYYDPKYLFASCPKLDILSLRTTYLPLEDYVLDWLFSPLLHIKDLDLAYTGLKHIPEVFSNMTSLWRLNLANNKIQSWNGTKMFGNSKLKYLDMADNQISVLNETSFPASMLKYLETLTLDGNPYSCTCQTVQSINWMHRHADLLGNYPSNFKCFSPSEVNGLSIQDYNPSPESCAEKNITLLVSVPVCIVTVAVITAIYLIYKCRWRLRYGVYLFNNRYKRYERIDSNNDFFYAGFVIYSDDDRNWVHNDLINRLENQEGFRLCIRLRDFEVGKVHVDNIVENMFLSEKIIVILSNNFANDDWCHFQLLLAETKLLKQNVDMLVIFMLDEIHSDCLRASLYKLVTEKQYALWSQNETGNHLFWEQALSQMKRSTTIN